MRCSWDVARKFLHTTLTYQKAAALVRLSISVLRRTSGRTLEGRSNHGRVVRC